MVTKQLEKSKGDACRHPLNRLADLKALFCGGKKHLIRWGLFRFLLLFCHQASEKERSGESPLLSSLTLLLNAYKAVRPRYFSCLSSPPYFSVGGRRGRVWKERGRIEEKGSKT